MTSYAIAVDVGGTFTDVVLSNLETGEYSLLKTPSTPDDASRGFLTGVAQILQDSQVDAGSVGRILHGTTVATNAILENRGATVGLLVSEGFKYVLEIGRHGMPRLASPYLWQKPPRPVLPENVAEVRERNEFTGEPVTPLDEEAVRAAARYFCEAGIQAIAISFLHSYANPANEQRAREIISEEYPGAHISLSSEVLPVFREYERTITTVLNAYVAPQVSHYVARLGEQLRQQGTDSSLLIMKSNGGVIGVETAARQPVYTALSGPAAGVMAAEHIGKITGLPSCISFDMGGTSTDVSLITEDGVSATLDGKLGQWPMQLPMLDIETIGAGGGSIAWLSPSGNLAVGPRSAGASPGPVCYGQGGTEPTVTDANLVLGRIGASLAGGQLDLDREAALRSIDEKIARPLNLEVYRAANGILQIVNNAMMGAIRNVSVERGYDPRDFALIAFGGAGPMHAIELARLMRLPVVMAPRNPGISSAFGLLVSELKNDYARTLLQRPPHYDFDLMNRAYQELEREGLRWLELEQVPEADRSLTRSADLRYAHQGFEISVDLGDQPLDAESLETLLQSFHQKHQQLFGFSLDQPVEIVTLRATALGRLSAAGMPKLGGEFARPEAAILGQRPVYFEETGGFVDCDLYQREGLGPDSQISGPAILQGQDSTVVINPSWQGQIDPYGNCLMRPDAA